MIYLVLQNQSYQYNQTRTNLEKKSSPKPVLPGIEQETLPSRANSANTKPLRWSINILWTKSTEADPYRNIVQGKYVTGLFIITDVNYTRL